MSSEAWTKFRAFAFDSNEQWLNYLTNLTFPENLSDEKKQALIHKYKKKFFSQHVESLSDFLLAYTQIEIPATGKHDATIIFLHGLGDQGSGWLDVFKRIKKYNPELASVKVILPNASEQSVTLNMGMKMPSWYDLMSLSMDGPEDVEGMEKCFANVNRLIEREMFEFGIDSQRIIIGGFSQGGSVAYYNGLTNKYKLGGIMALSTWMPMRSHIVKFAGTDFPNKTTPILQCHGNADPVVKYEWGVTSKDYVVKHLLGGEDKATNFTFKTYPGMGHSSSLQEVQDMADFIKSTLGC